MSIETFTRTACLSMFLWPCVSPSIRSSPCHYYIPLSRNLHMHAQFQLNRKPESASNMTTGKDQIKLNKT